MNRLAILVVAEAYAGDAHLTHRRFIRGDVLRLRGPAFAFTVLIVADAMDGYVFSVEKETTVRIEPNRKTRPVFFSSSQLLRVSANEA
jgi:hypothetical protein